MAFYMEDMSVLDMKNAMQFLPLLWSVFERHVISKENTN